MGREKADRARGFLQPARAAASKQRRRAAGTTETGFPSVWRPEARGPGAGEAGLLSFVSQAALPGV